MGASYPTLAVTGSALFLAYSESNGNHDAIMLSLQAGQTQWHTLGPINFSTHQTLPPQPGFALAGGANLWVAYRQQQSNTIYLAGFQWLGSPPSTEVGTPIIYNQQTAQTDSVLAACVVDGTLCVVQKGQSSGRIYLAFEFPSFNS
jgi:hypothetical protein